MSKSIKNTKRRHQPKKVNEIRTDYTAGLQGHPAYIYKKVGNTFHFIGITHAPITDRTRNIPLSKNPNPDALDRSYALPYKGIKNKKNFGSKHENWKISKRDKKRLKKLTYKKK